MKLLGILNSRGNLDTDMQGETTRGHIATTNRRGPPEKQPCDAWIFSFEPQNEKINSCCLNNSNSEYLLVSVEDWPQDPRIYPNPRMFKSLRWDGIAFAYNLCIPSQVL